MTELKIVFRTSNINPPNLTIYIDCDGCEYDASWNICEFEKDQDIRKLDWKPFSYHMNDIIHHLDNRHRTFWTLKAFCNLLNDALLADAWKEIVNP